MKVLTPEESQHLLIQAGEDGCYELLLLDLPLVCAGAEPGTPMG